MQRSQVLAQSAFLCTGVDLRRGRVGGYPAKGLEQARRKRWSDMIGVTQQKILVRNVETPQLAMQRLGTVVCVEDVPTTRVDSNCELGGEDLGSVAASARDRVIGGE